MNHNVASLSRKVNEDDNKTRLAGIIQTGDSAVCCQVNIH